MHLSLTTIKDHIRFFEKPVLGVTATKQLSNSSFELSVIYIEFMQTNIVTTCLLLTNIMVSFSLYGMLRESLHGLTVIASNCASAAK